MDFNAMHYTLCMYDIVIVEGVISECIPYDNWKGLCMVYCDTLRIGLGIPWGLAL